MLKSLRPGKSMSVLLQSQDADSRLLGQYYESSSSRSTLSTQSPRNWYRRALDRLVSQPGSSRQPTRLQGSTSIKELAKKTSHSLLNTSFNYHHLLSTPREDFGERNASLVQLPGSPGGQSCRPLSLIVHERTLSGLERLTPDQSGLSGNSGGPTTPYATESVYSVPIFPNASLSEVMGNSDSKLPNTKVSKIIRKPVSGLLRGKKSQQPVVNEDTSALSPAPEPGSEPGPAPGPASVPESAPKPVPSQLTEQVEGKTNTIDPGPGLRRQTSSSQIQIPRRRSSLTAIHLDSSHFEKPLTSKHSDCSNRFKRATGFSESFQPVTSTSGSTTAVPSPNPQEDNKSGDQRSAGLLSPLPSYRRPSDVGSTLSQLPTSRPSNIRFPETWPEGSPDLRPAALTKMHRFCSRSHKLMIRERAMFNQAPCMTCGIHDKRERFTCQWCELRLCDSCMRQLASATNRPLAPVLELVANKRKEDLARQAEISLRKGQSKDTLKQEKSSETLPELKGVKRSDSNAQSIDTVKAERKANRPASKKDPWNNTAVTDHEPGSEGQIPVQRVQSAQSAKENE